MSAPLRCRCAVGLSVLVLTGALNLVSAFAAPSSPTPAPTSSTSATSLNAATPRPSSSVSYHRDAENYSLTVSPTRLVVGQRDIGAIQKVTLVNRGQSPLGITVQKRNFTANRDGSLTYEKNAAYGASAWVTVLPKQILLAPGQAQVVTATVQTPVAREPGDHQMALVFLVPAGKTTANVRVNRGVGMPVYITAPGVIKKAVHFSNLAAPHFVTGGPVDVTATVENTGTVHQDFRAPSPLTVVAAGESAPFPDFTVPRNSVRNISTSWNPPFLCICHPTVTFDNAGVRQTASVRVIVFPWQWFAGGLGAVLLVMLGLRLARRGYRAQVLKAAAAHATDSGGDA